jgi:hypothetical protein
MIERFQIYFRTLEGLSTEELDRSAEKLVRAEKTKAALVIAHIAEISRRKGELERGPPLKWAGDKRWLVPTIESGSGTSIE